MQRPEPIEEIEDGGTLPVTCYFAIPKVRFHQNTISLEIATCGRSREFKPQTWDKVSRIVKS